MIRIPIISDHSTDIRMLSENMVLKYLQDYDLNIPQLLFYDERNNILLEKYIEGETLDKKFSVEAMIPKTILSEISEIMGKLHSVNLSRFPYPYGYTTFSVQSFYVFVHDQIYDVCNSLYTESKELLNVLKEDLDKFFSTTHKSFSERLPVLCHCDVHRKNLLVDKDDRLWLLDWELALIGDPLYDIAIHFQKMRYNTAEKEIFFRHYCEVTGLEYSQSILDQVEIYRLMEAVKYAVVDIHHVIAQAKEGRLDDIMLNRYYRKLIYAYDALQTNDRITIIELQKVIERLTIKSQQENEDF